MEKITTTSTRLIHALLMLCLLLSAPAQADSGQSDTEWHKEAALYLHYLVANNEDRLQEIDEPAVVAFYQARKFKPLWSTPNGRTTRAYDLFDAISRAEDEGLAPADYYLAQIREFWNSNSTVQSAKLDLLMTSAFYRYSTHVYSGRVDPKLIDNDWFIENETLDVNKLLTDVASNTRIAYILDKLPPQHSGYQQLKKQLKKYRALAQQGGWQHIDPGPVLAAGVQHNQVLQLRQRLANSGDLVANTMNSLDIFNRELEVAVIRFQQRHGLKADGRVGPQTRNALNVTVRDRIRQIRINMERWRWMPRKLGKRYLMVNMTGFELYIMQNGSTVLSMPVIIGKAYRSTPSFSGRVSVMEYNPYWTIPTRLALEDFIPRQIRDADFFAKKTIRVFRGWGEKAREIDPHKVDWSSIDKDHFPYWLRQDPGPRNALGRVKFLFSNPYEIYLHGTPDKHLFDRVVRTFSSGCIRVKDPVQLAAYLLNHGTQQMEEDVLTNIHLGTHQRINLPIAVPIYLVYWTAWVDQDGELNFRPDIYGRDARLKQLF